MEALRLIVATGSGHPTDFTGSRQQDAAEFIQAMMDCMKGELVLRSRLQLKQLFETTVREEKTCVSSHLNDCPTRTNFAYHPALLSLPVKDSATLAQSMGMFLGQGVGETVSVTCGAGAGDREEADICSSFHKLPLALVLQLKITVPNPQAGALPLKLGHSIRVPVTYRPKAGGPQYILTGALQQLGEEANTGHYVSFTRDVK